MKNGEFLSIRMRLYIYRERTTKRDVYALLVTYLSIWSICQNKVISLILCLGQWMGRYDFVLSFS